MKSSHLSELIFQPFWSHCGRRDLVGTPDKAGHRQNNSDIPAGLHHTIICQLVQTVPSKQMVLSMNHLIKDLMEANSGECRLT